jgi:hypothetical protein
MTVTETDIETLKSRVLNGLTKCNELLQQANSPFTEDAEFNNLSEKLTAYVVKLDELNQMLTLQGYSDCVFGTCKFNDEFVCFVCSRGK